MVQHNFILSPNKSKSLNNSLRNIIATSTSSPSSNKSEAQLKIENNICRAELEGLKISWHKIVEENMLREIKDIKEPYFQREMEIPLHDIAKVTKGN